MKSPNPRLLLLAALPLLGTSLWMPAAVASHANVELSLVDDSRELAGLAEEQALLTRQIQRLRQTMEVLTGRLEAEGRTHAVGLLREGLAIIDRRAEETEGLTLDERMGEARDELTGGQWMQSLERQQSVIKDLESLLEVLLDRQDLDKLEEKLQQIADTKQALSDLSQKQDELQRETREFEQSLQDGAAREFSESLSALKDAERELLGRTEAAGRNSTALERERIERELQELKDAEDRIAELLAGWKPGGEQQLADARADLEAASDKERAAGLLEETAARLERAAEDLAADAPLEGGLGKMKDALEMLKRAARDLGQQDTEQETTQAIAQATGAVEQSQAELRAERQAATSEGRSDLEQNLQDRAEELRERANELKADAAMAMESAAKSLGDQGEQGEQGDQSSQSPSSRAESVLEKMAEGAQAALAELSAQEEVQEFLPEAIAGAQDELAGLASELMEALARLAEASDATTEEGREEGAKFEAAKDALDQARAAMERSGEATTKAAEASAPESGTQSTSQASQEAKEEASDQAKQEASEAAAEAQAALEEALEALDAARAAAQGSDEAKEQAKDQSALAKMAQKLAESLASGALSAELSPESKQGAESAMSEAQAAMEQAQAALEEGRTGEAAKKQREALDALDKAGQEAAKGARPNTPEEAAKAEQLAEAQRAIEDDLLQLAERLKAEERKEASDATDQAADAAEDAAEAVQAGDTSQAQEDQKEVQREIEKAQEALQEEEERYQQLRQEEALLQMTEEIKELLEMHQAQMAELLEVDAARAGRETPSRAQKLRLRRIAREQETAAEKARELEQAILEEDSVVFAAAMSEVAGDLERIALLLGPPGERGAGEGYDSGERVQALQGDVERMLTWLVDALNEENERRKEESEEDDQEQDEDEDQEQGEEDGQPENRLVPSQAELKLLRSMEIDVARSLEQTLDAWPELAEMAPEDVDPLILEDIMRLALRHNRVTELFGEVARKLGVPMDDDEAGAGE